MTKEERKALGEAMHHKVYGDVIATPDRGLLWEFSRDQLFAEIWTREALTIRDRRLLILGVLAALGEPTTFEIHARAALANGELQGEQLREILVVLAAYCGYPRAAKLVAIVDAVIADGKKE